MLKIFNTKNKYLLIIILVAAIIGLSAGGYWYFKNNQANLDSVNQVEESQYIAFLSEVYDKIQNNYWKKINEKELNKIFAAGLKKLGTEVDTNKLETKKDLIKVLKNTFNSVKPGKEKIFTAQLANIVLVNLEPNNRSVLYTQKDQKELVDRVKNINSERNLYSILGLKSNASSDNIEEAYNKKLAELKSEAEKSQEAKKQLEQVEYSHKVLTDKNQKERYDQSKTEPTVLSKLIDNNILHLRIEKMSPTTLHELKEQTEKFENILELDSLILDLRGNVGGSIDLLQYLLGPFIGNNQYAYEFFHQGEITPFKTKIGWLNSLVPYKKVVVLIDNKTQSSGEVMASVLKKYNVGILVGTTTRGWGTIEAVKSIEQTIEDQKYSLFLVHSLTLRNDGKPIQENGVDPLININDPDWKQKLYSYFHYQRLINAVEQVWAQKY